MTHAVSSAVTTIAGKPAARATGLDAGVADARDEKHQYDRALLAGDAGDRDFRTPLPASQFGGSSISDQSSWAYDGPL